MSNLFKISLLIIVGVLFIASSGLAETWVVAQNGDPEKDFDDLTTAFTTLAPYSGTHDIEIREGAYVDEGLSVPANITSIIADGADVVSFTGSGSYDFLQVNNVPSGFVLSGMTITGYVRGIVGLTGTNAAAFSGNMFVANQYGVVFSASCTNKTVEDNCFIGNTTSNTYDDDANTWDQNYYDDYTDAYSYNIGGSGGMVDSNPLTLNNSAVGPASVELGETFTVEIHFTFPVCEAARNLAACNFNVNYNASKLDFVEAWFNTDPQGTGGFFGVEETGGDALYIGPDGSTAGTVHFAASNWTDPVVESGIVGYVTFTALMANVGTGITVGSEYLDGNNNPIVVGNTAYNVTLVDVTPPTLSIIPWADDDADPSALLDPAGFDNTFSDGSSAGAGPWVQFYLDMVGADDYDLDCVEYNWDGTGWFVWSTYSGLTGTSFTIPSPVYINIASKTEDVHTLQLKIKDKAGLYSDVQSYTFTIDRTGPNLLSIVMADADLCAPDPEYTNERTVNVTLVDDGMDVVDKVEWTVTSWGAAVRVAWNPTTYELPDADAPYTLYARPYDPWNNMGNTKTDAITLDRSKPVPTGWQLAGGAAKTSTPNIQGAVTYYGGSGAYELKYSDTEGDLVCGPGWVALHNPVDITLSGSDGTKIIYYAVRDHAGNISDPLSDDIDLDETPPVIDNMTVVSTNGMPCSPSWTVSVTVEWTDDDVNYLFLGSSTGSYDVYHNVSAVTGPPYSFTTTYTIIGGTVNGFNSVYAKLRDDILNLSDEADDDIYVDGSGVSLSSVEMKDQTSGSSIFSNNRKVDVEMSGSTDIVEICFSEDGSTYGAWESVVFTSGSVTSTYTFASPVTENAYLPLWVKARDCGGHEVVGQDAVGIIFDVTPPVVNDVEINGGEAKTNDEALSCEVDFTEHYPMGIDFDDEPTMSTTHYALSNPSPQTFIFTVDVGDGDKEVYVQLEDQAGNFSDVYGPYIIELDQTPPTGTYVVEQLITDNPWVTDGYTNSRNVWLTTFAADGDVALMYVRNTDGGGDGSPAAYYSTIGDTPWTLTYGQGTKTLEIFFIDEVGNWGTAVPGSIIFDITPPAPPTTFTAAPLGSALLQWPVQTGIQFYMLKYNYNGDYPAYTLVNPPPPAFNQGFPANGPIIIPGTADEYTFVGPHMDIYCFSLWAVDMAGNVNYGTYATSNLTTNYVGGDYLGGNSADGCIDYEEEFGAFAIAYNACEAGPHAEYYNPELDIAPVCDGGDYYPMPDLCIDFDDFVVFGMNYKDYNCANTEGGGDKLVVSEMAIAAAVPDRVKVGDEFKVILTAEHARAMLGYHLVLGYDQENLELVDVTPGLMHESVQKAFFYSNNETGVDISAVALGGEFTGEEMLEMTFRSNFEGSVELTAETIDVRDWSNNEVDVAFDVTLAKSGLPTEFALSQNYPNPFNPATSIELSLPVACNYTLDIYNITGQLVESISGYSEGGIETVTWDASALSSGIYLYRLEAGNFRDTKKMVLLK